MEKQIPETAEQISAIINPEKEVLKKLILPLSFLIKIIAKRIQLKSARNFPNSAP